MLVCSSLMRWRYLQLFALFTEQKADLAGKLKCMDHFLRFSLETVILSTRVPSHLIQGCFFLNDHKSYILDIFLFHYFFFQFSIHAIL
jgi:hypothetical protein